MYGILSFLDSTPYDKLKLSYDIVSDSEITPCNIIDKPMFRKFYDIHNNVVYIMKKLYFFYARNEISK